MTHPRNIIDGATIRALRLATAAGPSPHRFADACDPRLVSRGVAGATYPSAGHSGTRTNTAFYPLDNRAETRSQDWREILKKSRYLRGATGLVRALYEKPVKFVCPGGLTPNAATPDEAYNEAADAYFERHAEAPIDVSGTWDFYSSVEMIATEMPCDGNVMALKVKGVGALCQLQFFRAHQCGSGPGSERDGFVNGILRNSVQRKIAYRILQDPHPRGAESWRDYSAEDMLDVFDGTRLLHGRALPWIYHGANPALDVLDMRGLDQVARKLNLMLAAVIKRTGNARAGLGPKLDATALAALMAGGPTLPAADPAKPDVTVAPAPGITWEQILGGGAIPILGEGEEFQNLDTDRSPTNWIESAEFLIREIAAGYGVSYEFLWNMAAMGGPTARFILEDLNAFCEKFRRILISRYCQPYRSWVIANGIVHGELQEPQSGHWWDCVWSGPAKVTVDRGRDGALFRNLIQSGMMTLEEWWSLLGQDARRMRRKRIKEIKEDLAECEKQGIPYSLYIAPAPGTGNPNAVVNVGAAAQTGTEAAKAFASALKKGGGSFIDALTSICSRYAAGDDSEPRDEKGEWTGDGGSSSAPKGGAKKK